MTLARLRQRADFDALLAVRPVARSTHFAVHHRAAVPGADPGSTASKLSTAEAQKRPSPVDIYPEQTSVGCMIPKRHARRAVTRNMVRRQIYAALCRHRASLRPGHWLVRLHAGWPVAAWPSASSPALRAVVHEELEALMTRADRAGSGVPR